MNIPETQKDVLAYLDGLTRDLDRGAVDRFTTASIASALAISRNLASQYLNDLVRAKVAVKVGSRPVYYFHRRGLERFLQTSLSRSAYGSLEDLFSPARGQTDGFECAIGHDLSLSVTIERLRAAMVYPPCGIPLMLVGPHGTGKSLLARLGFECARTEGLVPANAKFVCIDCSRYRSEATPSSERILMDSLASGVAVGDVGMFYVKNVDQIPVATVESLLARIVPESARFDSFAEAGRNSSVASTARVILSSSCAPDSPEARELSRRVPLMASVPALHDRTPEERSELCLYFLKREGRRLGTDIYISRGAFRRLAEGEFGENVRGLSSCITSCCASAFLSSEGGRLDIRTFQLPSKLVDPSRQARMDDDSSMIDTTRASFAFDGDKEATLLSGIVSEYERYVAGEIDADGLMGAVSQGVIGLEDYLMFEDQRLSGRSDAYARVIEDVIDSVNSLYSTTLSRKSSLVITREVCSQVWPTVRLSRWKGEHFESVVALDALVGARERLAASVADRIASGIFDALGIELDALTHLLVTLHACGSQVQTGRRRLGVILAHGYSTATSIADAANRFLGDRVFEAIDMPYDLQVRDVVRPLRQLVDQFSFCDELAILVDTGSLRSIYKDLGAISGKTIGVMNNVSTGLAVEVGAGLLAGRGMEELMASAVDSCVSSYRVIERSARPDAIIFCEEGGIEAAEKIRTLVAQSLGADAGVRLVTCGFRQLMDNGEDDAVFSQYAVRGAIGTSDPQIEGVPFISLEDLIAGSDGARIDRVFSRFLSADALDGFHRSLIKNLTLRNVVESITILNPSKLFSEIERSVLMLQRLTGTSIEGRMVGLYVHLCCLVERLVTRTPIENCVDEEGFLSSHADFVEAFRESFGDISAHYHVEVPVAEIVYAYDYIYPEHALRKRAIPSDGSVDQQDE